MTRGGHPAHRPRPAVLRAGVRGRDGPARPRQARGVGGTPWPDDVVRDVVEVTFEDSSTASTRSRSCSTTGTPTRCDPRFVGQDAEELVLDARAAGQRGRRCSMGYQGEQPDLRVMTHGLSSPRSTPTSPRAAAPGSRCAGSTSSTASGTSSTRGRGRATDRHHDATARSPRTLGKPGADSRTRHGWPAASGSSIDETAKATEPPQTHVFMNNEYPIVFLMELARRNGYDVFLDREPTEQAGALLRPVADRCATTPTCSSGASRCVASRPTDLHGPAGQEGDRARLGPRQEAADQGRGDASTKRRRELDSHDRAGARAANGREEVVTDHAGRPTSRRRRQGDRASCTSIASRARRGRRASSSDCPTCAPAAGSARAARLRT